MKIAIIITGDVRDCFVKEKIIEIFNNYDVFCGSYIKHEKYISTFCKNNNFYLIKDDDIRMPNGIIKEQMQQNMLQWLHLDNIIKKFKKKLMSYDVILKYRFDYFINDKHFLNKISVKPNILYNDSDRLFYADSLTFIKVFETYYDNLKNYTYNPNRDINDNTFETSWKSENSLKMHLKKYNIINSKMQFSIGSIIRGNYHKVKADGNKKLYD